MRIAIPRETLVGEGRVAASPSAVRALVQAGHEVWIEQGAGAASGFSDDEYIRAGAQIAPTAEEVFDRAQLIWKVLRPSVHETRLLRADQRVAASFHAGAPPEGYSPLALERMRTGSGHAPVLAAMSEIAGRLAVDAATVALAAPSGGRGILLGGVAGVAPARVVVLGAGVAGRAAARLAAVVGADVEVLDTDVERLRGLGVRTLWATAHHVERALVHADVVIAAVRDEAGNAPRLATRAHLCLMQPGAVIVDLSITDGGAFESTPITTLGAPAVLVDGIVHIGVPNFAGGVPRTASLALSQAALPFILAAAG